MVYSRNLFCRPADPLRYNNILNYCTGNIKYTPITADGARWSLPWSVAQGLFLTIQKYTAVCYIYWPCFIITRLENNCYMWRIVLTCVNILWTLFPSNNSGRLFTVTEETKGNESKRQRSVVWLILLIYTQDWVYRQNINFDSWLQRKNCISVFYERNSIFTLY